MPGAEPIQNDGDKPVDGSLGWQGAGCRKRVQAVACQLIRRDVIADLAGPGGLDQQALDQVAELLLRLGNVLTAMVIMRLLFSMQQRREPPHVRAVLCPRERDRLAFAIPRCHTPAAPEPGPCHRQDMAALP